MQLKVYGKLQKQFISMKFKDIIGQESVKRRLRDMVKTGKIPHALLLEGEEGIGKLALARAFAQYIHCPNQTEEGEPCGECPICKQYNSFNQPDTFFEFPIYKKKSGSNSYCDDFTSEWHEFLKDNVYADFATWNKYLNSGATKPVIYNSEGDAIIGKLGVKAYSSSQKIMIMWLPEKMNEQCANHLLKMIEEPYEDTILLFVSNNSNEILPTIYSRVQRIIVKPLSPQEIADYLVDKYAIDDSLAMSVANSAEGSITRAESLIGSSDDDKEFLDYFKRLMRSAYTKSVRDLKDWSEEVADFKREKGCFFLNYVAKMVRENFIYNIGNPTLNYMRKEEEAFSVKFSPFINERNINVIVEEVDKAVRDISRNANMKIVLFDFALKMTIAIKM